IRELSYKAGRENTLFIHVVYVPFIGTSKEFKTKPAQNALADLRGFGIVPDAVIVRTDEKAPELVAEKISLFGGVPQENVLLMPNADTVYRIPLAVAESGLHDVLTKFSGLTAKPDLSDWEELIEHLTILHERNVTIGLVA